MGLDNKCTKFNIIINLPINTNVLKGLDNACNILFSEWSYIKHDKDKKSDNTLKTIHYHLVAKSSTRIRLATIINKLSDLLNIDTMLISCKRCVSYIGAIQYLIHKNDLDKFQYDKQLIVSNIPNDELFIMLDNDNDNITIDRLILVIKNSKNVADVIQQIGLSHYIGYRNVIKDLWSCRYEL